MASNPLTRRLPGGRIVATNHGDHDQKTHGNRDALRRAFKDGYTRNDGFSLDSKRVWPLRSTHHTPGGHEHDQKTHGGGGGGGNFVQKGGLEFTKAESRTYRLPGTGQKIDPKDIVGSSSGIYPAAVRMRDGSLILGSSHYSIFTGHVFPKGYKPTDVRSYGYYNREDGEFFPLLDDDSAHAGAIIDDAWKDHQNTGWSLDKRIWPLRSTHHLPGQHDQKDHGNRQGVGGKPDDHGTKIVGGLELRKGWDVRQPVDKSKVTGYTSAMYASVQAVRMKDGSVHASDNGHSQAMYEMMRKGYKREDFQSVGFYLPKKSAFEPYHVNDIGHIKYMMDHAEQRARTMDLAGWSLDRRDK